MKPVVLSSLQTLEGDRCVDIFERDDGSFGFEEWRRDWESLSGWFAVGHYADDCFGSKNAALTNARRRVSWLAEIIDKNKQAAEGKL